jgi:hypothetical protein
VHIVAMLARQDRRKPSVHNDRYRVRDACLAAEQRYGLRPTAPADRTAPRSPTRGEKEKAAGRGLGEAPRLTLRRHVATAAASAGGETEFFARLEAAGVLVRQRYSTRNPGEVTGYAVALPGDTGAEGGPVWYGGGKLAADLTWPRLRQRWAGPPGPEPLTAADRSAVWEQAARAADQATAQIRAMAGTSPAAAADAAWAASDILHAAAAALGSEGLRQAADAYDRAARAQYGRIPAPGPAGNRLRQAARLISAYAYLTRDPARTWLVLIARLAALAEAVGELRDVQQRAAQATAARTAARHLHAATRPAPAAQPGAAPQASTAARLAAVSFPESPAPDRQRPGPGRHPPGYGQRPVSGPSPPRPRGPRRLPVLPPQSRWTSRTFAI